MFKTTSSMALGAFRGLAFAAATAIAAAAWAATPVPAQTPLISRVASPPPANVMITIDDSGSMQANFMPEGSTKTNGFTVAMPSLPSITDFIDIWYGDKQIRTYDTNVYKIPRGITYAVPGGSNTFQKQIRSSSVNSIFYNPAVLYLPWLKPDGVTRMPAAVYTAAYWDPVNTNLGSTNLSLKPDVTTNWCGDAVPSHCSGGTSTSTYDPGLYYVLTSTTADPNQPGSYTEYDLNDGNTGKIYPAAGTRVCTTSGGCCSVSGCTLTQERQNFANWFVYYRTRTLLMKGAMSESLSGVVGTAADMKLRVGFGTINSGSTTIDGKSTTGVVRIGMRDLDSTQLNAVLTGIQAINPSGSTPLRQATVAVGDYFTRDAVDDSGSPWRTVPGTTSDGKTPLACRRSYELLTTDGYYNDSPANAGSGISALSGFGGDIDSNDGPAYGVAGTKGGDNPLGLSPNHYVAGDPYKDSHANMLADYGMAQYVVDLQPKLENRVPANSAVGDVAYWQHLSMMTVGLGVQGQLQPSASNPDLPDLTNGWGTDKIDDLWHAAVDTHGKFFSARDVVQLTEGLTKAFGSAAAQLRNEGGAATSVGALATDAFAYLPGYFPVTWNGTLEAHALDPVTGARADAVTWEASKKMPAAASRSIYTWDGSHSIAFNTSMPLALKSLVAPVATQDNLINYIRGDRTNEGSAGLFRQRTSVLGDFIDSPPLMIKDLLDSGYDSLTSAPNYRAFYLAKHARSNGVIVLGANDGMLHAFRTSDGVEVYGYVPKIELPNLATYAAQDYGTTTNFHRDYVDGPQVETDAYVATKRNARAWADLVVGSFGAGAPGLYALDLTDVTTFDDKTLLWETPSDPDIGYITSKIATGVLPASGMVGHLTNGSWKAFVGNGVDSVNGNAILLIVDLETGAIDKSVRMPTTGVNGLMGVKLVYNSNKEVVAAYAGDLQGNLWRVDFTGASAPTIGFGNAPLFKAVDANGVAQPIVEAPAVYPRSLGNMVLFGTGKLIDAADADSATPQTFYGVWDDTPQGAVSTAASRFAGAIASGTQRQVLTQQTITPISGTAYFQVTSNPVDFVTHYGWYMDLSPVNTKQRVIYSPLMISNYVLINTMAPGNAPAPQSCDQSSGTSAYFLLPAESGAAYTDSAVWDTDGDGVVGDAGDTLQSNGQNVQAAGYTTSSSGGDTNIMFVGGDGTFINETSAADGQEKGKVPTSHTIKKRVWQQLMTPPF